MDHSRHTPLAASEMTEAVLRDCPVYDREDNRIGTIGHLHQGAASTKVVIDVGGFLGIGTKPVAVGLDQLDLMRDENGKVHGVSNWTKDELRDLPEHKD
ncbi:PRC-barrel domain-containing protein [Tabrizicola soli]|uniref:PRC-barrel domain-containing protein n=1 Tax=Tabrizicola soli TaxID=2185115 RepID=A0ABV7DSX3_9RHOB|nr:PRC-barrel domain-containing protein [Tabrizicola soli]